jgi:hypothetical protein
MLSWTPLSEQRAMAVSYLDLRKAIGVIGVCLPIVVWLGALILTGTTLQGSISSYYYTVMSGVLVGSLCATGVFLLFYRYAPADFWIANVAGVAAIGVALFPTAPDRDVTPTQNSIGYVHLGCASVFFGALAIFCFVFTRSATESAETSRKRLRNIIYRICGVTIVLCLIGAVVVGFIDPGPIKQLQPLFWLESFAIFAFGVSWFIKGETLGLLADRPAQSPPPAISDSVPATAQ